MKKTKENLWLLYMLFGVALVTANAIATKVFDMGFKVFGNEVTLTVGVICYPVTFLVTDIIGELWGKEESKKAVKFGFICQLISTAFIIVARYLPAVDPEMQKHYVALLGQNWIFVVASMVAFVCSQSWDVFVFHKVRDAYIKKHGSRKGGRWIWNNASTIGSQLIDSIIYVIIAFGFGFGWLFNNNMRGMLLSMIVGQFLCKAILALLDTPIFYLLTNERGDKNGKEKNAA
jgi:uncharacterized integral membrane protein (TIGR00697 family)